MTAFQKLVVVGLAHVDACVHAYVRARRLKSLRNQAVTTRRLTATVAVGREHREILGDEAYLVFDRAGETGLFQIISSPVDSFLLQNKLWHRRDVTDRLDVGSSGSICWI